MNKKEKVILEEKEKEFFRSIVWKMRMQSYSLEDIAYVICHDVTKVLSVIREAVTIRQTRKLRRLPRTTGATDYISTFSSRDDWETYFAIIKDDYDPNVIAERKEAKCW